MSREEAMRRLAVWGLGVGLLVCLGVARAAAADKVATDKDAASNGSSPSWFSSWFSWGAKPAEKKPAPPPPKAATAKPAKIAKQPTVVDTAAAERAQEQATLLRRLDVCDRLMQIAVDMKDEELQRQIEQLEERARIAYAQRTAYLPAGGAHLELEEQILEKHLGGSSTDHASGASASITNGADALGRTAAREVKP
jgi:hypothetical protein